VQLNTQILSNLDAIANDTSAITIIVSVVKALVPQINCYATRQKTNVKEIAYAKHLKT
jgi:hypothetical protein